ncbi:conserved exported hypothetical protein [Planktothrix serta PCC 8927]|uniref:Lipoprotein n=1 Tax=Planktothrix serta PCC 8927 TaxID=671068 RepID=A0A7Z9BRK1_9CYAN|nr:DUF6658 family protein [Planktothrix serta]VXD19437.1 conserved exported hypothetical protein [Planktothrix serta PCC 8927]
MKKLIEALRSVSLKSIMGVFLAGVLLLISTACSNKTPTAQVSDNASYNETQGYKKELYHPVQDKQKGGMYPYSDTDVSNPKADAKAKALIDSAKSNINKVNNPQEFVENYKNGKPLPERVKDLSERVGESASEVADDWMGGTKRGMRNVKNNTKDALDTAKNQAEDTSMGLKRQASKGAQHLQEKAEDAGRAIDKSL